MKIHRLTLRPMSAFAFLATAICVEAQDTTITNNVFKIVPAYTVGVKVMDTNWQNFFSIPPGATTVLYSSNVAESVTNWLVSPLPGSSLSDGAALLPASYPTDGQFLSMSFGDSSQFDSSELEADWPPLPPLPPLPGEEGEGDGPPPPGGGETNGTPVAPSEGRFFRLSVATNDQWELYPPLIVAFDGPLTRTPLNQVTLEWSPSNNWQYYVVGRPTTNYPGWYMFDSVTNSGKSVVYLPSSWPTNTAFRVFGLPDPEFNYDVMTLECPSLVNDPAIVAIPFAVRLPVWVEVHGVELWDVTDSGNPVLVPGSDTEGSFGEMRIPGIALKAGTRQYELRVKDLYGGVYLGPTHTMTVSKSANNLVTVTWPPLRVEPGSDGENTIFTDSIGYDFVIDAEVPPGETNGTWTVAVHDDPLDNGQPGAFMFGGTFPADGSNTVSLRHFQGSPGYANKAMVFRVDYQPAGGGMAPDAAEPPPKLPDPTTTNWHRVHPTLGPPYGVTVGAAVDPALYPTTGGDIARQSAQNYGDGNSIYDMLIRAPEGCFNIVETGPGDSRNVQNVNDLLFWVALNYLASREGYKITIGDITACRDQWQTNTVPLRSGFFLAHANDQGPGWGSAGFNIPRLNAARFNPKEDWMRHAFFLGCKGGAGGFLQHITNHEGANDVIEVGYADDHAIRQHLAVGYRTTINNNWERFYFAGIFVYYSRGPDGMTAKAAFDRAVSESFGGGDDARIVCVNGTESRP